MTHELSFTERYNKLMGVALLRLGYLGEPTYYGSRGLRPDAYAKFGMRGVGISDGLYGNSDLPSLESARCPTCEGAVEVIDVREVECSDYGGTFGGDGTTYHIAQGVMACSEYPDHTDEITIFHRKVSVDATISEMVCLLDDTATELGY